MLFLFYTVLIHRKLFDFQTFSFVLMGLLFHCDRKINFAPFYFLEKTRLIHTTPNISRSPGVKKVLALVCLSNYSNLMPTEASSSLDRYRITVHQQESPLQLPRICRWHRQQPHVYVHVSNRSRNDVLFLCLFCVSTGVRYSQLPCDLVLQIIGSLLYSWFQSFWHQALIFRLALKHTNSD